ncbi:hypothetical protein BV898_15163 [Hypsibius exemplaris]|uniref:Uncharacterized protein n=1 Tax=Hypsibius exemplaris TaxID=2072580 RepID=A0A9X6NCG5_HYPEX|nr:hypothetical protein BV898_15163 [Hypsibius exemplaris]
MDNSWDTWIKAFTQWDGTPIDIGDLEEVLGTSLHSQGPPVDIVEYPLQLTVSPMEQLRDIDYDSDLPLVIDKPIAPFADLLPVD